MDREALLQRLGDTVGAASVLDDSAVTAGYARDMMPLASAGQPLAVVFPASTEQVQAVVRLCGADKIPIVPRGAGSGLSGAANAVDGCVVLVLTKMDRVLEIDPGNRLVVVEPGVVNLDLRAAVEQYELFYPPDPSSYDWCTIGGNLATNAGGLCCVKYGVTTDSVLGLEVVLADGSLLKTGRRTVKGVAGYDLTKLFVGSEGTLGVITKATLALKPLPQSPGTLIATFTSVTAAGEAVSRIIRAGLVPSLLEIMDSTSIRAAEEYLNTDLGAGANCQALLLAQSDAGGEKMRQELSTVEKICQESSADTTYFTEDFAEGALLLQARRSVLPALERYGVCLTDDLSVPRTRIAELLEGCEHISAQLGLRIAVIGHAGDGNMHPNIVYSQEKESEPARQAFDAILALTHSLGGTVTGEHGVGRIKREWLEREIGPIGMQVHRHIKAALDPNNLFNPGSMFSMP